MRRIRQLAMLAALIAAAVIVGWRLYAASSESWLHRASPGALSAAHAFLTDDCAACHTPVKGPEDANCIACHGNDTALLQRQPTAFHADIGNCARCHIEHRGQSANLRQMDHATLAQIGKRDAIEMALDCRSCHATKDRHQGLFGQECASCHATTQWTIAEFQHPSPRSYDCAQCHQAPPSHSMMHFSMVSKKIARQEDSQVAECCGPVQVDQCYRCHQTTSWNDIKAVGWYKHH